MTRFRIEPPAAVGIVDGEFYQSLAVSPKEILPLLDLGIPVLGSSSMGALRAVELAPYGMIGVGKIFAMYRRTFVNPDDEVAMTFCPETLRPLSEPLVNIRIALRTAVSSGLIRSDEARCLTGRLKALYFPDRTLARLFREAGTILNPQCLARLQRWWAESAPDTKARDAQELLFSLAAFEKKGMFTR